jgi:hypothetical protein
VCYVNYLVGEGRKSAIFCPSILLPGDKQYVKPTNRVTGLSGGHKKQNKKQNKVRPGLPDGLFLNQKSKFGLILEGLAIEDVGIFYGRLVYFTAIWYLL